MGKAVTDRLVCDRGYPQTFDGFSAVCFFQDPSGNQLALTPRIGGNDDLSHVVSVKLCFHCIVLFGCLFDHHQLHFLWNHGEMLHFPLPVLFVIAFRVV